MPATVIYGTGRSQVKSILGLVKCARFCGGFLEHYNLQNFLSNDTLYFNVSEIVFFYHSNVTIVTGTLLSIDQCVVRVNGQSECNGVLPEVCLHICTAYNLYSQLYTCNDIYMFHEGGG